MGQRDQVIEREQVLAARRARAADQATGRAMAYGNEKLAAFGAALAVLPLECFRIPRISWDFADQIQVGEVRMPYRVAQMALEQALVYVRDRYGLDEDELEPVREEGIAAYERHTAG
ncbi:hypothetical protein [Nocardiopsis synnemataformans]|uniref:hypothetical protein n=1 Tax=Nocardiopsis synnemataformans TaxID=61305 RepID=UPI003EBD6C67